MKSFIPPKSVSNEAKQGLNYLKKGSKAGTRVGRYRATQLSKRKKVSEKTLKRMVAFFKRHKKNKSFKGNPKDDKGYVAWKLWGGDSGFRWAKNKLKEVKI